MQIVCGFREGTALPAEVSVHRGEDALEPAPSDAKELLYSLYSHI